MSVHTADAAVTYSIVNKLLYEEPFPKKVPSDAETIKAVQEGSFIVPEDCYAVSFEYKDPASGKVRRTARFYPEARFYDIEQLKDELGSESETYRNLLYACLLNGDDTRFIKTRKGQYLTADDKDRVIERGKAGSWNVGPLFS